MQFQRVHPSIVRSIRQISLMRNWTRARAGEGVPAFCAFVPDVRADDAADLMIAEVRREGETLRYFCRSAGPRVVQIYGQPLQDGYWHDAMHQGLASAARPGWDACVSHGLPLYTMIPVSDAHGVPVTIEQIFLPYAANGSGTDMLVAAVHAWSTEGRFSVQDLLKEIAKPPLHWSVIVDPSMEPPAVSTADVLLN